MSCATVTIANARRIEYHHHRTQSYHHHPLHHVRLSITALSSSSCISYYYSSFSPFRPTTFSYNPNITASYKFFYNNNNDDNDGITPPNPSSALFLFLPMEQFWAGGRIDKNKALVEYLKQYGVLKSEKVAEVMERVDRRLFVTNENTPYVDNPMPIGYNATISAPHMHAMCLELLKDHLQPGMHALDVGSGSGYLTACFSMMVGPEGHAVGVEHIPELVAPSIDNLKNSAARQHLEEGSLSIHVGDGRLGWPEHAPYDAIHVGAAASEIPQSLIDQLKPGGRMVIPVGNIFQDLQVVEKRNDGSIDIRTETSVRYVPLTSREAQLRDF